jgi:hypothetical protein
VGKCLEIEFFKWILDYSLSLVCGVSITIVEKCITKAVFFHREFFYPYAIFECREKRTKKMNSRKLF